MKYSFHRLPLLLAWLLCMPLPGCLQQLRAATYYVDFDAGSDSNDGLSTSTPWRTIPATRNAANDGYKQAAWGGINTGNKIPTNSIIYLKRGTTYSVADGGSAINITTDYYTENSASRSAIIITPKSDWGSGLVTLDAASMPLGTNGVEGFIAVQMDGLEISGQSGNELWIVKSSRDGIHVKEKGGSSAAITNFFANWLVVSNCGTSFLTDTAAAGGASIHVRKGQSPWILNSWVFGNGGTNFVNGVKLGDSGSLQCYSAIVSNCTMRYLRGDTTDNDAGIGIKGLNSDGIVVANTITDSLKGMDFGEQSAASTYSSLWYIYNNTARSNIWGINGNWSANNTGQTNKMVAKLWNNLIISNLWNGANWYAAGVDVTFAHNTFAWNGDSSQSSVYAGHIRMSFNSPSDTNNAGIRITARNNIFFRGYDHVWTSTYYNPTNQVLNWDTDNNLFVQSTTDSGAFANWGVFESGSTLNYVVGWSSPWQPGSTNGWWYLHYAKTNTAPPAGGNGHFNADSKSAILLSGDSENSQSIFWADTTTWNNNYKRNGTNLTGFSWYDSRMANDKNGNARSFWSMGAYDGSPSTYTPPVVPVAVVSNTASISIPASGNATPYPSTITVPTISGTVTNVTITFTNLGHLFNRDIDALLVGPGGQSVKLMSDCGDGTAITAATIHFDDLASGSLPSTGGPVVSGTFKPTDVSPTETFGAPAPGSGYGTTLSGVWTNAYVGTWSLYMVDDGAPDGGALTNGWTINLYYTSTNSPGVGATNSAISRIYNWFFLPTYTSPLTIRK